MSLIDSVVLPSLKPAGRAKRRIINNLTMGHHENVDVKFSAHDVFLE
jgi:hypothetical protein